MVFVVFGHDTALIITNMDGISILQYMGLKWKLSAARLGLQVTVVVKTVVLGQVRDA
tara:strand:- start:182 stop:352 length:171 start_codon:yes stop_codon:yes gene_type:complete